MKCSSIKLAAKENAGPRRKRTETKPTAFIAEKTHSYSFPFIIRGVAAKIAPVPSLAIKTLDLPANVETFNTGSSLDKWSKKRPRLKSGKSPTASNNGGYQVPEDDRDFCYESLETDLSLLFELDEGFSELNRTDDGSLSNLQYEVHSDIEQLLLKTERSQEEESSPPHHHRKRTKVNNTKRKKISKTIGTLAVMDNQDANNNQSASVKNRPKTIKFSLSKPASPQTEQVIRVDVTSNVSVEDFRHEEENADDCSARGRARMIDGDRKELKRNLNECDDDFIVRCRQLALKQRRR